jgi:hypothetical protein
LYQALSVVWIAPRSVLSLNFSLPMKLMPATPVRGPSLTSNTRSTRFWSSSMILGSTRAA